MPNYTVECGQCGQSRVIFRNLSEHGAWPDCCGAMMHQAFTPPQVMPDIASYQAVGTDIATGKAPIIRSRTEHREYLKRNGYIEVGNEAPKPHRADYDLTTGHDIKRAIEQVKSR